ncbi:hypothetical protein PVK06_024424 [Gossypium arboreum]|uniref:Uncharacterized protein n=1 Tax=Gossypium arboreum TaxID=29729 RepID=A0ABR0PDQ0_GOSAR|nr:hypothetical protein PVK06_024424 [Gossypium arboreum]
MSETLMSVHTKIRELFLKLRYEIDMDSECKRDRDWLSAFPRRVSVQESEVNTISPTSSSDNSELGTEALTQVVREVLEKVFEARLERTREMLQAGCVDCGKKRDRNPLRLEPLSAKRVRTHLSSNKSFAEGASSGVSAPFCEHYKKRHLYHC